MQIWILQIKQYFTPKKALKTKNVSSLNIFWGKASVCEREREIDTHTHTHTHTHTPKELANRLVLLGQKSLQ